jgi:hypothetical protein
VQEIYRRKSPPSRSTSPSDSDTDDNDNNEDETQTHTRDQQLPISVPNFSHPHNQPRLPYLTLSSSVQLPQSLLHEPWTPPKLDFLKYLVWSGCSIDWASSSRGEMATAGLATAISIHSHTAVALLCSPSINVIPDTTTLKIAVMDHNCNPSIVFYLLAAALRAHIVSRASGESPPDVNFRDPSLWHWVERVEKTGNKKGRWLKDVGMKRLLESLDVWLGERRMGLLGWMFLLLRLRMKRRVVLLRRRKNVSTLLLPTRISAPVSGLEWFFFYHRRGHWITIIPAL